MAIFLSGGGSGEKSREIDLDFINRINKNKPILYIPLARKAPYDSSMDWIKSNFNPLGFNNFEMVDNPKKLKNIDLSKYSGIYIGGGNTYKLLKELQDNNFINILKKYIKDGGIFYGGSAGAIILGKDIGTSDSKNECGVKNNRGLKLLGKFSVFCHYKEENDQKILDYIKQTKNEVLAIPENAGVLIDNLKIKTIGPGKVTIFVDMNKKILVPNTFINSK
ncbi:MAG: Type 1 glutamine amidotransferase-like domain-containing protein [archaeon]|nr:Type 1 glutamine amidotransferase-like domain-containing protein [archaeon]